MHNSSPRDLNDTTATLPADPVRILLVEPDGVAGQAFSEALQTAGYLVLARTSADDAERYLEHRFDIVIADLSVQTSDGQSFLRAMRGHFPDATLVATSLRPDWETAARAIEHRLYCYLPGPVLIEQLLRVIREATEIIHRSRLRRSTLPQAESPERQLAETQRLEQSFAQALDKLWMAYQPLVKPDRQLYGYEALLRTDATSLSTPPDILACAERLGRLPELGRAIRNRVATDIEADAQAIYFVNLHPVDLFDEDLFSKDSPLARHARRVVLEVTERASVLGMDDLEGRLLRLRALGYRIAIDDLGAGYSSLLSFARLAPEVVKLDMSLIRDIDHDPVKKRLVLSMTGLCREMKVLIVAEGIETEAEADTMRALGVDLFQGYLFGRPARERIELLAAVRG